MTFALRSRSVAIAAALLVVTLAGFALRWRGVAWGLPHQTYRDGMVISTQVEYLRHPIAHPESNEFWGYYPHLMSRVIAALPDDWEGAPARPMDLDEHLARASEPWLMARELSVLLSLLAIPGAFFLAREFTGDGWALFAAALVAFSTFHLSFAQQEKPHGPVSGTVVLATLACMRLARKPSAWSWILATLATALACVTAFNGVIALLAALAAVVAMLVLRDTRQRGKSLVALGIVPTLALLAAAVWFFYPFLFDRPEAREVGDKAASVGGHTLIFEKLNFGGAKNMFLTLYLYEPVLLALVFVATLVFAVRAWKRRRLSSDRERARDLIVILPMCIAYGAVLCVFEDAFDRFLMPLVPFLAAFAVYGAAAIASKLRSPKLRVALAALLVAEPAAATWQLSRVRAADDTQTQVARWIEEHASPEQRIFVMPYLDLPLFYSAAAVAESPDTSEVLTWMAYQSKLAPRDKLGASFTVVPPGPVKQELAALGDDPFEAMAARGADYVVIQAFGERYRYKVLLELRRRLRERAERVFVASPYEDDDSSGRVWIREKMTFDQVPIWLRVFRQRCIGTTLEIYRMPKDS